MTTFEDEIYLKSLNTGNYVNIYQKMRDRCRGYGPAITGGWQAGCPNNHFFYHRGQSHSGAGGDYRGEQIVSQNQYCYQQCGRQDRHARYEGLQGVRQHVQEEEKNAGQSRRGDAAARGDTATARRDTATTRSNASSAGNTATARDGYHPQGGRIMKICTN